MTEVDPVLRLHLAMRSQRGPDAPTPDCLDDDTIAALADGTLEPALRAAVLPHMAACPSCRTAVGSVARALGDSAVSQAADAAQPKGRRYFYRIAAVALPAAAAVVLLLARPQTPSENPDIHRAPTITAAPAPALTSPVGVVSSVREFRWAPVPGADGYRLTLFGSEGHVLYETEVAGATAALPDTVVLAAATQYLWKIEARTGFDRWSASELVSFSIGRGGAR